MNAKIINPFVVAAFDFLEKNQKMKIRKGTLSLLKSPLMGDEVNTLIRLTGLVNGQVIYSMSRFTAQKIASWMLMGMPVEDLDGLAASAISEMGNIITGNASCNLTESGFFCVITPPTLSFGKQIKALFDDVPILVVPIQSDFGEIKMIVELKEAS